MWQEEEEEEEEDQDEDDFGERRDEDGGAMDYEGALVEATNLSSQIVLHEDKKYYPEVSEGERTGVALQPGALS